MFIPNVGKSNSALSRSIADWANKKLISITDFDGLMNQLDKDFLVDESGQLLRKQTMRLVSGADQTDRHFSLMVRANVTDKSFGAFQSRFKPRRTTDDERKEVGKLFTHYQGAGLKPETIQKLQENFVVDSGKLRKLDTATGYISTDSFDPEHVIQQYEPEIDKGAVELNVRREQSVRYRMAQELSMGEGEKTVTRLFRELERINQPKFPSINHSFAEQEQDMKRKSMSYVAILDERDATLAEQNRMGVLQKSWLQQLNTL